MAGKKSKKSTKVSMKTPENAGAKPVLLSGGNPQIAKADGSRHHTGEGRIDGEPDALESP